MEDIMKFFKIFLISLITLFVVTSAANASDFDWMNDFNIQAQADPSGFRARLATRFKLGDVEVRTVLSNVDRPADAYLTLRFGEMSGRPTSYVVEEYRKNKGKGWGSLAKSLGIKPGSEEFHALKISHDLQGGNTHGQTSDSKYNRQHVNSVGKVQGKDGGKGKNHK
jgi:hypothetical protein